MDQIRPQPALTPTDKQVLGWSPGETDPVIDTLAGLVASDRFEGTLTGPITPDYILGNQAKGIAGLVNRGPAGAMSSDMLSAMRNCWMSETGPSEIGGSGRATCWNG